jgi:hypothetical protein
MSLVVMERTLSIAELQAISYVQRTYTLTRSGGRYVTDSAVGCDLAALLTSIGIDIGEIAHFTFVANDGINPGSISPSFLFTPRYYYPLIDWGVTNEATSVAPMLAYAASWKEGGIPDADYSALNSGTRLRLLFGSTGLGDNSTMYSLKYINTMTIVMEGAPPINPPEEPDEPEEPEPSATNTNTAQPGSPRNGGTPTAFTTDADDKPLQNEGVSQMQEMAEGSEDEGAETNSSSGGRWQVFEMMRKMRSDIDAIPFDNPWEPYTLPIALTLAAAGSTFTVLRHRRRTGSDGLSVGRLGATATAMVAVVATVAVAAVATAVAMVTRLVR